MTRSVPALDAYPVTPVTLLRASGLSAEVGTQVLPRSFVLSGPNLADGRQRGQADKPTTRDTRICCAPSRAHGGRRATPTSKGRSDLGRETLRLMKARLLIGSSWTARTFSRSRESRAFGLDRPGAGPRRPPEASVAPRCRSSRDGRRSVPWRHVMRSAPERSFGVRGGGARTPRRHDVAFPRQGRGPSGSRVWTISRCCSSRRSSPGTTSSATHRPRGPLRVLAVPRHPGGHPGAHQPGDIGDPGGAGRAVRDGAVLFHIRPGYSRLSGAQRAGQVRASSVRAAGHPPGDLDSCSLAGLAARP